MFHSLTMIREESMFSKSSHQFTKIQLPIDNTQGWAGKNLTAGDFGFGDEQEFGHGMFGGIRHFDNKSSPIFTRHEFGTARNSGWDGDNLTSDYYGINENGIGVQYARGVFEGIRHFGK